MTFTLPNLPYAYDALEPFIDAKTMEIHHSKHHQAYTNNLNSAVQEAHLQNTPIEIILKDLDLENKALRNNAGGYYNHNLFWQILSPEPTSASESLLTAINRDFGSFEELKKQLATAAASQFGSGWAWLCVHKGGQLEISATANQDNPLMPNGKGGTPIIGIDVWEHAYYLKYQNRRPDYIQAVFSILNWEKISQLFEENK